jgi:Kdo2-lipid IVA lauroyltransferase/acyltransferase
MVVLPLSRLPYIVLYGISDVLFYFFYYIIRYRKKVVFQNIRGSFPDRSQAEHEQIAKKFYSHFCDLLVESLKIFSITEEEVKQRMKTNNPEVVDHFYDQGRSVILVGGHYNNWELFAVAIDGWIRHNSLAIYKPLNNKFWDSRMRKTREKYGLKMISIRDVAKVFEENRSKLTATIFAADQSPGNVKKAYWMNFLNRDTAVLFGTEKYAREYNYPVIFGRLTKVKRGHYVCDWELISENPVQTKYGEITEAHTRLLEKDILNDPPYWLWSHRRWKKKRLQPVEELDNHG